MYGKKLSWFVVMVLVGAAVAWSVFWRPPIAEVVIHVVDAEGKGIAGASVVVIGTTARKYPGANPGLLDDVVLCNDSGVVVYEVPRGALAVSFDATKEGWTRGRGSGFRMFGRDFEPNSTLRSRDIVLWRKSELRPAYRASTSGVRGARSMPIKTVNQSIYAYDTWYGIEGPAVQADGRHSWRLVRYGDTFSPQGHCVVGFRRSRGKPFDIYDYQTPGSMWMRYPRVLHAPPPWPGQAKLRNDPSSPDAYSRDIIKAFVALIHHAGVNVQIRRSGDNFELFYSIDGPIRVETDENGSFQCDPTEEYHIQWQGAFEQ
jgi:hypothetical protein